MAGKKSSSSPSPTEVGNWNTQIIPKGETTVTGGTTTSGVGTNPYAKKLYDMTNAERKTVAQALKNAGYRVNTNGIYSRALVDAYSQAVQSAQLSAQELGQSFNDTFFANYLAQETLARGGAGAGTGRDGTYTTEVESVITKANAEDIVNKVIKDKLDRAATDEEIARYTGEFKEKAAAKPTITTTITSGKKTKVKTQPGFTTGRAEQYLIDKIAGTDEARANQVLSYYETAVKVLAGE